MNHVADITGPRETVIQIYEDNAAFCKRWHYEIWIDMSSDLAPVSFDAREELLPPTLEVIAGAIVTAYSIGMDVGVTNAKYSIRRALGIS